MSVRQCCESSAQEHPPAPEAIKRTSDLAHSAAATTQTLTHPSSPYDLFDHHKVMSPERFDL